MSTPPKRKNVVTQVPFAVDTVNGALVATFAEKLVQVGRQIRIDSVKYVNPTGLTNDAANFYVIQVKNGATVIATWSTETDQEGALVADTFVDLTLAATPLDLVLDPADELSVSYTLNGTQTLPAGRLQIKGRFL